MNQKFRQFAEQFIPYIILGVSIALILAVMFVLINFFFWGILIGAACYAIAQVKNYFFPTAHSSSSKGRLIEYDDIDP